MRRIIGTIVVAAVAFTAGAWAQSTGISLDRANTWAKDNGYMTGERYRQNITREQVNAVLMRYHCDKHGQDDPDCPPTTTTTVAPRQPEPPPGSVSGQGSTPPPEDPPSEDPASGEEETTPPPAETTTTTSAPTTTTTTTSAPTTTTTTTATTVPAPVFRLEVWSTVGVYNGFPVLSFRWENLPAGGARLYVSTGAANPEKKWVSLPKHDRGWFRDGFYSQWFSSWAGCTPELRDCGGPGSSLVSPEGGLDLDSVYCVPACEVRLVD